MFIRKKRTSQTGTIAVIVALYIGGCVFLNYVSEMVEKQRIKTLIESVRPSHRPIIVHLSGARSR